MRRRTLLRRGTVLAALGLAGCIGDDQGPTETVPPATDTRSATPETGPETTSPASTPSASPTQQPTTTSEPSTETDSSTPTPTETPTPTATPRSTVDQEVAVGPGSLTFEPKSFQIATGDTVRWIWESSGHNVKPSAVPEGADWTGTAGDQYATYDEGHVYTYTFEVAGSYEYYCAPHRSAGMTGSFTVG